MKNIIENLNKLFESRIRLGVMSVLIVSDWVDFKDLKEKLQVTDGNLASHITALEKNKFIEVRKSFIGKKPNTSYRITDEGKVAFTNHINALESLIKGQGK